MVFLDSNQSHKGYPMKDFNNLPKNAALRNVITKKRYGHVVEVGPGTFYVQRTTVVHDLSKWLRGYFASINPTRDPSTVTDEDVRRAQFGPNLAPYSLRNVFLVDGRWNGAVFVESGITDMPENWELCDPSEPPDPPEFQ